jgi:NAD(P)-dependent dehydrogenase (short-subunit alcohol dehydrogenase family)
MKFEKLNAIVSGAASGLGFATCERIVKAGGKVAMLDLNDTQGTEAAKKLGEHALFIKTDVSSEQSVAAAVEKAKSAFGNLQLVVNCAGILGAGRTLGREGPMATDFFARTIQVNLIGSFNLIKAAANVMQHNTPNEEGERGVIVNTASVAAFEGQIGQAAYSASKGGVVGMTLPIAREFARFGIRVMTIAPGIFWTPMMAGMSEEVQKSLGAQVPFPSRLGKPEEFANTVAFILGNRYLNGETIRLDGAVRLQPK